MVDWFQNHTYSKERVGLLRSPKKPRAIGGVDVFEQKYKDSIMKKVVDVCQMDGIPSKNSVHVYKQVLQNMYQDAEPDIKATCKEEAKASNDSHNEKPPATEIFA
jgi:hypothetical protein